MGLTAATDRPGRIAELTATARGAARILAGARLTDGRALRSLAADAEAALADARLPGGWRVGRRLTTVADVAVLELRDGDRLAAVLQLGRSPAGDAVLREQHATLAALAGDERLGGWRRLLPEVLAHGTARGPAGGHVYTVERAVPGTVGTALPDRAPAAVAAEAAAAAAAELHRRTGRAVVATPERIDRWLEPAATLLAGVPTLLGPARRRALAARVRARVRDGLTGRTVWVARTHGDLVAGNVFHDPSGAVTGLIDWGQSRDDDAALIDPATLLLTERARARGAELGTVVRDLCRGAPLTGAESELLARHRAACPADPVAVDVLALLAWLRHVENNLRKSPRYGTNPVWVRRNVEAVLRAQQ